MKAYYNDNDKHAVAWLKELINAGLIMDGDVDDRSIADVTKEDLKGYVQCHFFAGIGGWAYALQLAGWPVDQQVWSGSAPCQPFSVAGKGGGYSDERHLWPEFRRLIMECKPEVVFGEQVASKDGRNWLSGNEILQSMLDRETIVRVLQICDSFGELPPEMQRMLQGRGAREKKSHTKRGKIETLQKLPSQEQGIDTGDFGKVSSQAEGAGILFGSAYRSPARCDRCGRLRTNGHSFQSYRGEDMGQSFSGQGGLFDGVYAGQCACGTLLRECDGEPMGAKQDNRDSECDHGDSSLSVRGTTEQIRIIFEATDEHRSLAGVRADLEAMGYAVGAADLCAAGVFSPHIRQRVYWMADSDRHGRKRHIQNNTAECRENTGIDFGDGSNNGRLADSDNLSGQHSPYTRGMGSEKQGREGEKSETWGVRETTGNCGSTGRLADSEGAECESTRGTWSRGKGFTDHGSTGRLADSGYRDKGSEGKPERTPEEFAGHSTTSRLADSKGHDARQSQNISSKRERENDSADGERFWAQSSRYGQTGGMGDADSQRRTGEPVLLRAEESGRHENEVSETTGPSTNFWSDFDLIPCGDGKARRVESGTFPLAHGVSGRVGLLRGYGNAIVPEVAAEFVRAFMETDPVKEEHDHRKTA